MKKNIFKSVLSVMLALAMLCSAIPAMFASAEEVAETVTAENAAPNTKVFATSYFNDADFKANFTAWGNNKKATIADGVLSIGEANNVRASMWYHNVASLNQTVTATVATGADVNTNAVIWVRMNAVEGQTDRATGYYVKLLNKSTTCTATLFKAHYDETDTYALTKIGELTAIDPLSGNGEYLDATVRVSAVYDEIAKATAVNVAIYKDDKLMYTKTVEDNESELQVAGHVGLAANAAGTVGEATADYKAFGYYTTDNNVAKTIVSTSYFSATDFANDFMTINNNKSATVSNGKLVIASGTNQRNTAQFVKGSAANQTVMATMKTPHSYDGDVANYVASTGYVWLSSNTITRPNGEVAPYGYYVALTYTANSSSVQVNLYKQGLNDTKTDIASQALLNSYSFDTKSSSKNEFVDAVIKATISYDETTGANTITLQHFKGTYHWAQKDVTVTDYVIEGAGNAGLVGGTGGATFTQFEVKTTDAVANAYAVENTAKDKDTMFGQILWVDPTATYQFSAMFDGNIAAEPLAFMYRTANGGTRIDITEDTEGVTVDTRYNKYTYTIDMSTLATGNYDSTGMVPVKVGFAMKDGAVNLVKYTNFELRKVTDGKVGANLIINGDFKMGGYGWSEDATTGIWNPSNAAPGSYKELSSNKRMLIYADSNDFNYAKTFAVDNYADYLGDANGDDTINVKDLVRVKKNTANDVYNIYADMDQNGELSAEDVVAIRTDILNSKN